MVLGAGSAGVGLMAGALSILSPCVLPLIPIVIGTATASHRFGALALALGLAISFTAVGMFVATIGFAIGLDADWFRASSDRCRGGSWPVRAAICSTSVSLASTFWGQH